MKKLQRWLGSLLVLQLVIASVFFIEGRSGHADFKPEPLLSFNKDKVNKIRVSSGSAKVTLVKDKGQWTLPELNSLPVSKNKLNTALQNLQGLSSNWPVTTTGSSHERFEVSENKFQRKIDLYRDEALAGELFIGSSPGFKKVHVRPAGENNVYALLLSAYDFPTKPIDWLDKNLLSAKKITTIKGPDYALRKVDEKWQIADGIESSKTMAINRDKADQLSQALTSLSVMGLADKAPEFSAEKVVTIEVSGEDNWQYQFLEKEGKYYVKRGDIAQIFTLNQHEYQRLASIGMADLSVAVSPEAPKDAAKDENANNSQDG